MSTRDFRLLRLEKRYPRRPVAPSSSFDPSRLTLREQVELDDLLRPFAPLPGERWNLDPLTDEQLDRAVELTRKAEGREPNAAYLGLRRRGVDFPPCRCPACARREATR